MEKLLKPEITSALGWTLLHSLWQGLVLAILYFGMSKLLKSSEIKYRLGIGAMLTQFGLAVGTFFYVGNFSYSTEVLVKKVMFLLKNYNKSQLEMSLIEKIQFFLSSNLTLIVQIWLVGVSVFFIKLIFDVWAVNRMKTNGLKSVNIQTQTKFNELIKALKITKKIEIFESNQTSSPIVIGNLKPFILLPMGLTSDLTINELEAILAHELAHIKRYDFLVNILQSIVEIIFFFNPMIWWISAQVRQEREHCCDDFSVAITGDKMLLVNALAQVETFRINQPLAMAFGKKKMTLLSRVKRILGVNNQENRSVESIIVMLLVSVILGGLLIFKSDDVVGQIKIVTEEVEGLYGSKSSPKKGKIIASNSTKNIGLKTKNDTSIKDSSETSEKTPIPRKNMVGKSMVDYSNEHKYIHSNSKRGEFWINKNGEIYIDSKKYNASPELLAQIKPFLKKIDVLNDEMSIYSKKMEEYSKEMNVYSKKMEEHSAPMQVLGKQMEMQGKLLGEEVKLQTKYSLKASLAELENEKANTELYKKLEKAQEKKVDEISKEMDRLGKEMEKYGKGMEDQSKPMEEIGKKMEGEGSKMWNIGNKMEAVSKEIINLLPEDLRKKIKDIEKEFNH
jgi:bla regulator protein blaR1